MKKYFLGTILVGLLVLGGFSFLRARREAITVEADRVQRKTLTKSITASGELDSEVKAELKFESSGRVVWLAARVGERVEKNQALASLDKKTLEEQLRQAEAARDKAIETRREFREAHKSDSPSQELFSQFAQYDAQVRSAESGVEEAQIALDKATLISSIAGIITEININEGAVYQTTSGPAITVANFSPENLYFKAEVDEEDLGQIFLEQQAEITLDADTGKTGFIGKVREMAPQTSLNEAGDKVVEVKINFEDVLSENLRLLGLSGDAEIIISRVEKGLILPFEAIVTKNGENFVWKIEAGKARKVGIEIGLESEFEVEIISGLSEGDLVASEKLDTLKEGQKVKVK